MNQEKIEFIKAWLGTGSVNFFGLPMSGKDTVGIRLAEDMEAKFLSSGDLIRAAAETREDANADNGKLIPTDAFYDIILPHFYSEEVAGYPLVLSSIGRWAGEETEVMKTALESGHEIKAVVFLDLSEPVVRIRWAAAKNLGDRGLRADDLDPAVFETRILEFHEKTEPVLAHYRELGRLVSVSADASRDEVYANVVDALYDYAVAHPELDERNVAKEKEEEND